MNRTISRSEAPVLEQLEMERPELVTMGDLATLLDSAGVRTLPRVFAARLRAKGWLLPTEQRGVWEFAPAALAGPYSSFNPALPLRAFLAKRPGTPCGLTFQAAAWAHGCADRVPARPEVAVADALTAHKLPPGLRAFSFTPALSPNRSRGVPVLMPESVLTHMCTKPVAVRSWNSALDWLPELAAEANIANIEAELSSRPRTVAMRMGYLLQSLRPDIANSIAQATPPTGKTWFGPRGPRLRYDRYWRVSDTLLSFNPRGLKD